jgi:hypothetical protein
MARLSGLDKDTAGAALRTLVDVGLVEVQQRRRAEGDPRTSTWLRLRADVYPAVGEPYLVFPAEAAYGGYWAGLPGEGFRHLLIAWAAAPPYGECTARKLSGVEGELGELTGMGRTAVRTAAAAILNWRGPQGARLVVRRSGRQVAHLAPPRALGSAARKSGALPSPARAKPAPLRPERPQEPASRPLAPEGTGSFEARKAWWIRRHLPRWAAAKLRGGAEPVVQAVYVDLAPGEASHGLPLGLAAACAAARLVSSPSKRAGEAVKVYAVEPDPERRARLIKAAAGTSPRIEVFPDQPEEFLQRVVPHRTGRAAAGRESIALLFFLGSAESPAIGVRSLRDVAAGAREAVALSEGGDWEHVQPRLWRGAGGAGPGTGSIENLAWGAMRNGVRRALAVPLQGGDDAPAGTLLHLASTAGALATLKSSVSPREQPEGDGFRVLPWVDLPGMADQVARRFAGRQVRWSGPRGKGPWEDRVRTYLLRDTPVLPRDLARVRLEMVWRGWRVATRPAVFDFPPRVPAGDGGADSAMTERERGGSRRGTRAPPERPDWSSDKAAKSRRS